MNTHLCVNTGTHFCINFTFNLGGRRGRDRMVVGFTTTYAIRPYHQCCCIYLFE
jgi:hypothetical protein